jgi:monofunctional chorismate mutase
MTRSRAGATGVAAVRGAVQAAANRAPDIHEATARLLVALLEANSLSASQVVSAVFTATPDLDADFPAHAARRLGWSDVPLLGAREMGVPGSLPRVIRVLLTVSGVRPGARLAPVYLDGAAALRSDLAGATGPDGAVARRESQRGARRLGLVGLGQIGGSIGLALGHRGRWWRVGHDRDRATLAHALAAGAIDEAANSVEATCKGAALAVLATPVDMLPALIGRAARALPRDAALLDTGSARATITPALERAAARGVHAVGGHPIAGSEARGFAAARADLFADATFAVMPARGAVPAIVRALVRDLGARALRVGPEAHDRALARTSHLPYLVACAIEALGRGPAGRGLAGPGYRGMTRLAASDPRMARAYCRANRREIAAAWRALRAGIGRRIEALEDGPGR